MNSPRCRTGICGFACSKYKWTSFSPSCRFGNGACLKVGRVCKPKKESLMVLPLDRFGRGLLGRTPALSELLVETELLTAAKTTLAKDIPDVEPRNRGSDAPWTDTMPM